MKLFSSPWIDMNLDAWASVLDASHIIHIQKQSFLFFQGEEIESVYIVRSGRILLSVYSLSGIEKIVFFATCGCILGEQLLVSQIPQPYTARTVVDCSLYKIPQQFFKQRLLENPELGMAVLEAQLKMTLSFINHITELSFDDAYHRVIRELLYCAEVYGERTKEGVLIKIPISQEALGKRVLASRITINKTLKLLKNENLVGRKGQYFILLNVEALIKVHNDNR